MSFSGSLSRSGGGLSFAFVTGFVAKTQAPPLLLGCGLHCTGPTNVRQSQWETVISCAGGQVFLVRLGGASSAMRAVHVAAGCSMKEGSTISVSFWLRMPLSRGCWLSVTERSVLCPLSLVRSCCPPSLLCEELAVILVDGCGCGVRAHPCEATP